MRCRLTRGRGYLVRRMEGERAGGQAGRRQAGGRGLIPSFEINVITPVRSIRAARELVRCRERFLGISARPCSQMDLNCVCETCAESDVRLLKYRDEIARLKQSVTKQQCSRLTDVCPCNQVFSAIFICILYRALCRSSASVDFAPKRLNKLYPRPHSWSIEPRKYDISYSLLSCSLFCSELSGRLAKWCLLNVEIAAAKSSSKL